MVACRCYKFDRALRRLVCEQRLLPVAHNARIAHAGHQQIPGVFLRGVTMGETGHERVTEALAAVNASDSAAAADRLLPLLYDELRVLAHQRMRRVQHMQMRGPGWPSTRRRRTSR